MSRWLAVDIDNAVALLNKALLVNCNATTIHSHILWRKLNGSTRLRHPYWTKVVDAPQLLLQVRSVREECRAKDSTTNLLKFITLLVSILRKSIICNWKLNIATSSSIDTRLKRLTRNLVVVDILALRHKLLLDTISIDNTIHNPKRIASNSHTALDIVLLLIHWANSNGEVLLKSLTALRLRSTKRLITKQLIVAHSRHLHNHGIALREVKHHNITAFNLTRTSQTAIRSLPSCREGILRLV